MADSEKINLNIKLDRKVRDDFSKLCDQIGITMSGAVNAFMKQSIRQQQFFFSLRTDNQVPADQNSEEKP